MKWGLTIGAFALCCLRLGHIALALRCEKDEKGGGGACNAFMLENACTADKFTQKHDACRASATMNETNAQTVLKVGIIKPLSGIDARWEATSSVAIMCALEDISSNPSLLPGVKIEAIWSDSEGHQLGGVGASVCLARSSSSPPPIVIGPAYSSSAFGASRVANAFGMALIGTTTSNPLLSDKDSFPQFSRVFPSDLYQGAALADVTETFGWKSVAMLSMSYDAYSTGLVNAFVDEATARNIRIGANEMYYKDATDEELRKVLRAIRSTKLRVIILVGYAGNAQQILSVASEMDMHGAGWVWIGTDAWAADAVSFGDAGKGIIGVVPRIYTASLSYQKLLQCVQSANQGADQKYKDLSWIRTTPGIPSAFMYDAVQLASLAYHTILMESSGNASRFSLMLENKEFVRASLRNATLRGGCTGNVSLDDRGDRNEAYYTLINIQNSEVKIVGSIDAASKECHLSGEPLLWPGDIRRTPDDTAERNLQFVFIFLAVVVILFSIRARIKYRKYKSRVRTLSRALETHKKEMHKAERKISALVKLNKPTKKQEEEFEVYRDAIRGNNKELLPQRINLFTEEDFVLKRLLGKGSYGEVYLGEVEEVRFGEAHKKVVAVKQLLMHNEKGTTRVLDAFIDEVRNLARIGQHKNIVAFYGVCWGASSFPSIILEYVPGGELNEYLEEYDYVGSGNQGLLGKLHFIAFFISSNLIIFPMQILCSPKLHSVS